MSHMRMASAAVLGAAVLLAGCGSSPDATPGTDGLAWDDLSGRTFVSTQVRFGGEPTTLVADTVVRLTFGADGISASAGCNTMGGDAHLDGDRLVVDGGLSMTEMGCPEPRMDQDSWLADVLSSSPALSLDGDRLSVTGTDDSLAMVDEKTVNPDRSLEGTVWTLTGILSGSGDSGAVSSIPTGVTGTVTFDGGVVSADAGCNRIRGSYRLEGDRVVVSGLSSTKMACPGDRGDVEAALTSVLGGTVTFVVEGDQLSLVNGAAGLFLRAE
jgi:heat shock protein HslJ